MLYTYFDNLDDLNAQSVERCMTKVEDDFLARAPKDAAEQMRFIDEIPCWTARVHGKKYCLMMAMFVVAMTYDLQPMSLYGQDGVAAYAVIEYAGMLIGAALGGLNEGLASEGKPLATVACLSNIIGKHMALRSSTRK